ncbi:hypothetical protein ACFYO1_00315 [Nocardia sp. NPDC006044]
MLRLEGVPQSYRCTGPPDPGFQLEVHRDPAHVAVQRDMQAPSK